MGLFSSKYAAYEQAFAAVVPMHVGQIVHVPAAAIDGALTAEYVVEAVRPADLHYRLMVRETPAGPWFIYQYRAHRSADYVDAHLVPRASADPSSPPASSPLASSAQGTTLVNQSITSPEQDQGHTALTLAGTTAAGTTAAGTTAAEHPREGTAGTAPWVRADNVAEPPSTARDPTELDAEHKTVEDLLQTTHRAPAPPLRAGSNRGQLTGPMMIT